MIRTLKVFDTSDMINEAAADFIVRLASESIKERGRFLLSLSGGNTPGKLYSLLSSPSFKDKIDWKKTFVFWGDERFVPPNDERNNAHMARSLMFDNVDIPNENIFPIQVDFPPSEAAIAYEKKLKGFFGKGAPRFDLILLGLGENGHTASLFPGTPAIRELQHWLKEVYVEEQKEWRITMTAPLINQARNIAFLVSGKAKANILEKVLNGSFQPDNYPAQLIQPVRGHLFWFADKDACSELSIYS
jgi:6-phosphogluconolactonase